MKDFMFIFRGTGEQMNSSPEQMQGHMQKWMAWIDQLKAKKHLHCGRTINTCRQNSKGQGTDCN